MVELDGNIPGFHACYFLVAATALLPLLPDVAAVYQAEGAALLSPLQFHRLLESYLLGSRVPSEQQQLANQQAVIREASLALQGAVRVMQVSTLGVCLVFAVCSTACV